MKEVMFYQEVTVFDFAVRCVIVTGFIVIGVAQIIEYFKNKRDKEIRNDTYSRRCCR